MLTLKVAIYKTVDGNDTDLLYDIVVFKGSKLPELIASVRKWLDGLEKQ